MGRYLNIAERATGATQSDGPCSASAEPAPAVRRAAAASTAPRSKWPPESLEAQAKFGAPYARLFPFIGRKVRTPDGPGVLHQVFRERCAVALDAEALRYLHFFLPAEIEPVSWLVGDADLSPKPSGGILEGRRDAGSGRARDEH